jgi:pyruvate/2-oxoglutarate/acetoin dehydrogenase E1 component
MSSNLPAERPRTVLASLNQGLHGMMEADLRVVVLGEDLLDPYGGAFKVTKGLSTRFPDRVLTTPISEAAIVGLANGMAMRGMRPIAEIMFGDFLMLAGDQLVNHAAKFRWMGNDQFPVPLVVRAPMGGRRGYGPTHSQCLEKHFLGVPGLWVVAPHLLGDPGALLRQATLECDDPVLFIESKACYGKPLETDLSGLNRETFADEAAPFPTTLLQHAGAADGLLCCYGGMTSFCLDAVRQLRDQEGLCLDLAVFTQLSPTPASHLAWLLGKRHPTLCVYAEEGSAMGGWSAEMVAQVEEYRADKNSGTIRHERIGAAHVPLASSRELEAVSIPQVADIVQRVVSCF